MAKKTRKKCSVCGENQFNTPSGMACKNGHGGAESTKEVYKTPKTPKTPKVVNTNDVTKIQTRKVVSVFDPKPGGDYSVKKVKIFLRKINEEIAPMIIVSEDLNPSYKILEPKTRLFRVDVTDTTYLNATVYTSADFKKLAKNLCMEVFGAEITHSSTGSIFWFISDN